MVEVSVPCGACGKPVRGGDEFCEACGAKVGVDLKAALRDRLEASHSGYAEHKKKMSGAQGTIGALSILFVIGGIVFFFITQSRAETALAQLAGAGDGEALAQAIEGYSTVGELRAALRSEPYQVLGLNLFLAVVMAGLWYWSKRALLPAIISALGIYVAVQVGSVLIDPTTVGQGLLMKILITAALIKGVQSAFAARKLELAR